MKNSLNALDEIHEVLKDIIKFSNSSFSIYSTEKTVFVTKIRHYYYSYNANVPYITTDLIDSKMKDVPSYSMGNLVNDCESMVINDHYKNVVWFISTIDKLLGKTSELPESSEGVLALKDGRVQKAVEGPFSRVSYGLGSEKLTISI